MLESVIEYYFQLLFRLKRNDSKHIQIYETIQKLTQILIKERGESL